MRPRPAIVVGASTQVHAGRPPGARVSGSGSMPSPSRVEVGDPGAGRLLELGERPADPGLGARGTSATHDRAGRVAPSSGSAPCGQQPAQHLVGGPAHGGDGGDAEPLVDLGAARVVDAGHDVLDAERLAGHPGGDDVGVVAAGDRGEGVGVARCRPRRRTSRSKPTPVTVRPSKSGPSRRNASASWSMTATVCPRLSRLRARVEPTRPQPMITTCTAPTLHACDARGARAVRRPRPRLRSRRRHDRVPYAVDVPVPTLLKRLLARPRRSAATGSARPCCPSASRCPVFASRRAVVGGLRPGGDLPDAVASPAWRRTPSRPGIGARASSSSCSRWSRRYRQNVHAYPSGGGDYEVATVNLGPHGRPDRGQRAARRLRADRRGVDLLRRGRTSARRCRSSRGHEVADRRRRRSSLLTAMNLRGVRESGTAFAVPTYALHGRHHRHDRLIGLVRVSCSATTCRAPRAPSFDHRAGGRARGLDRARAGASCCCGRSPPAAPR